VRRQFGLPIGKFEGVEQPLARIAGSAYMLGAARRITAATLDHGEQPSVLSAILKYHATERMRSSMNDALDIHGGRGICDGPRNYLFGVYQSVPVAITVEGANILTRSLMIFGQGAIRCHPYIYDEIQGLMQRDVKKFDAAFTSHIGHTIRNKMRAFLLSLTRGRMASSPVSGPAAKYWRKLAWASASFAFLADIALIGLGGNLKRKEKITGRFADIFSWLYLSAATLRRFEAEGQRKEDLPYLIWSLQYGLGRIQKAFDGLYKNFDVPVVGVFFKGPAAWWSRINSISNGPSDRVGHEVARLMQTPGEQRQRLTAGIYVPDDVNEALGRLENAFRLAYEGDKVARAISKAIKAKKLPKDRPENLIDQAAEAGVITYDEASILRQSEAARNDAIQVDSFTLEEYMRGAVKPDAMPAGDGATIEAETA
jgi:acyl-CoA dehydrogenase